VRRGFHRLLRLGGSVLMSACKVRAMMTAVERRFSIQFGEYFAAGLLKLKSLKTDRLVDVGPREIRATPHGRLLLRVLAMCFDRYLTGSNLLVRQGGDTTAQAKAQHASIV